MNHLVQKLEEIRLKTRKLCSEFDKVRARNVLLESEKLILEENLSQKKKSNQKSKIRKRTNYQC
jgi:hypothetical protein